MRVPNDKMKKGLVENDGTMIKKKTKKINANW